jgi:L-lactate dehydrogenase complex protein LldG
VHVAIIEPSQLIPDLFDVFEKLDPEKDALPTNVTLITGPSKTGDIQLKLTTGVHGPGEVHALVVG